MRDELRLIAPTANRYWREVGGIGFHQQPVARDRAHDVVGVPFGKRHDATEGHVPTGRHCRLCQGDGAGVAVQDPSHPEWRRVLDQRACVRLGVARMDDDWTVEGRCEGKLIGERRALPLARGVVVVVVQSTFTDRDRSALDRCLDPFAVCAGVVRGGVVRVDAGRARDERGIATGQGASARRCLPGLADADQADRPGCDSCVDDAVPIGVKRAVGQVGVAVEERQPCGSPRA